MLTSHNHVQYITSFSGSYLEGDQRESHFWLRLVSCQVTESSGSSHQLLTWAADGIGTILASGQYCFSRFYFILLQVGNVAVGSVAMSFITCQDWLMFFAVFSSEWSMRWEGCWFDFQACGLFVWSLYFLSSVVFPWPPKTKSAKIGNRNS